MAVSQFILNSLPCERFQSMQAEKAVEREYQQDGRQALRPNHGNDSPLFCHILFIRRNSLGPANTQGGEDYTIALIPGGGWGTESYVRCCLPQKPLAYITRKKSKNELVFVKFHHSNFKFAYSVALSTLIIIITYNINIFTS